MPDTAEPTPRETRRDVSWAVMFRLARTGVWVEWSNGHRDPAEAVQAAEPLETLGSVAEVRIDRITRTREMFDPHELTAGQSRPTDPKEA